jgi:Mce-associated membrane protein
VSDTPTWYDVLDVSRDASAEEVRDAWKTQISDLEPGDRRFDALNRAAKVLLDPAARAAYDVEHPAAEDEPPEIEEGALAPVTKPSIDGPDRGGVPSWLLAGLAIVAVGLVAATLWTGLARDTGGADDSAAREAQRRGGARRRCRCSPTTTATSTRTRATRRSAT